MLGSSALQKHLSRTPQCLNSEVFSREKRRTVKEFFRIHIQHVNPGYFHKKYTNFQVTQPCNEKKFLANKTKEALLTRVKWL